MSELHFPKGEWDVVVADPPWSYYGQQDKWGAASKFYETQSDKWIFSLPINDILKPRGVLFLWATSPRLDVAIKSIDEWGLYFRGVSFVWVKCKKDGSPIGAQGVRPSIVKPTCEFVLSASKVKSGRPLPIFDESIQQVVLAQRGEHSEKPHDVYERIEKLYPSSSKIDLFARKKRPGWDVWGNEINDA